MTASDVLLWLDKDRIFIVAVVCLHTALTKVLDDYKTWSWPAPPKTLTHTFVYVIHTQLYHE